MADLNDIRDEFSPLLDDELSADARHAVEAELAQDSDLLRELDALRKVDNLYRGLPRVTAPDDMAARVREQLHAKPKVLPLRTRQFSRTLYTSFAAAAIFAVLIGGVVLRREFYVSPSAQDRFETAARMPGENESAAAERPATGTLGSTSVSEPSVESDGLAEPQTAALKLRRDQEQPSPPPPPPPPAIRAEAVARADTTAPSAHVPDAAPMDDRAADEAKPLAAATPAPAPVESSTKPADKVTIMAEEAEALVAGGVDADMAEVAEPVEMRQSLAKKSANAVHRIADREFEERDDGWYERGYDGESVQTVRRGSETLNELASSVPKLSEILALKGDIVFKLAKTWYRVPADRP